MKTFGYITAAVLLMISAAASASNTKKEFNTRQLPDSVYVGGQKTGHVQGIAYDKERNCIYMSFTTRFLKVDMNGNIIASIERVPGHLGAMAISPADGNVYASLECLDDAVGKSVSQSLGMANYTREQSTMYVAVIDVEKLTRIGMDSSDENVLRTFCVRTATEDYLTGFHGCSGIDGVAFVPGRGRNWQLCVAYGIYEDLERDDNDCQILLTYDIRNLERYLTPVDYTKLHRNGPEKPLAKYYIYTGNTMYGVQNLAYDEYTGKLFMFVYKGHKPQYPNCNFFTVDWKPETFATTYEAAVKNAQPLGGWKFKWGSTGIHPLGDGYWFISENAKNKADNTNSCNARLYFWDPLNAKGPFIPR